MSKLNALGLELLDLKTAIATEYPEVVRRAIEQSVNDMLKNEIIDQETHYLLNEHVFALNDFKTFCLGKPAYCKSEEEMLSFYEEKRIRLEEALQQCIEQQNISVVNYLKDEQIMVVKAYQFGMEQVKSYFGIESNEDAEALMGRKRFVERFIALRYPKILKDFIQKNGRPTGWFQLGQSSVYYDEEANAYTIELLFKIKIETFEDVEVSVFERPILRMIERCNQWFNDYLGQDGQFYGATSSQKPAGANKSTPPKETQTPKFEAKPEPEVIEPQPQTTIDLNFEITPTVMEPTVDEEFMLDIDLSEETFTLEDPIIDFKPEDLL